MLQSANEMTALGTEAGLFICGANRWGYVHRINAITQVRIFSPSAVSKVMLFPYVKS